jgi:dimethylglycine dehydrogenase
MLNHNGKLIGDFTIAKFGDERFVMWGSIAAQKYHYRWFEQFLPDYPAVSIRRFDLDLVGLSIAGPSSRHVLAELSDIDVSNKALRFMDSREIDVNGAPCIVNRISYTGDLGYEIWMAPAYQRKVYDGIKGAGKAFDIIDFGMRALLSMRLEKNFPTWFAELRPIYGPYEGAMDRFIKLDKNDFVGRKAAALEYEEGPKLRRVSLVIEAGTADVMADEPIWAKVGDEEYNSVVSPHGYGAPRFDIDGQRTPKPNPQIDGEWRVVGWVTSGGYGHYVEASLAQAYLPSELAYREDNDLFEVEILGLRYPARIAMEPLFDPDAKRMRS